MADRVPGRPSGQLGKIPLRILRIDPGTSAIVRTLAESYKGCMTHWSRGQSHYCPGEAECPPALHRNVREDWKGYTPVEEWHQHWQRWIPAVLEITEGLDQDFRSVFGRGQVWEISRLPQVKGKKSTPVKGKFLEQRDPDTFPQAFDIRNHLVMVYHVRDVVLLLDNPMPARMMVEPSEGAPPPGAKNPAESKPAPVGKTMRQLEEELKARKSGIGNGALS